MKKKNILVFGAAGFIGTYLVDELVKKGFLVTASDIHPLGKKHYAQKKIPFVHVDITCEADFKKLGKKKFDVVIHLAAWQPANISQKNDHPQRYIDVNLSGTLNILEFCRKTKAGKLIYASSHRNTQGMWDSYKVIREKDGIGIKYTGEYAMFSISETAAQDCVAYYQAEHDVRSIIFRLPPVYGFGPHTEIFKQGKPIKTGFQVFIDRAMASKPLEVWGNANRGRDIVYIKDVVSAFILAIGSKKATGLYNISSGTRLTLKKQAQTIAKIFWGNGKPKIIMKPKKPNHIDSFQYDISKAKKDFGWKPKFDFEAMLLDYIKENDSNRYGFLLEKRKKMFKENK